MFALCSKTGEIRRRPSLLVVGLAASILSILAAAMISQARGIGIAALVGFAVLPGLLVISVMIETDLDEFFVIANVLMRMIAGALVGWLCLVMVMQFFSPPEEAVRA